MAQKATFALCLRNVTAEGQRTLAGHHTAPDLLDTKLPVAMHRYLLEEAVVFPDDDEIYALAKRYARSRAVDAGIPEDELVLVEPSELDCRIVRQRFARQSSALLIDHQNMQVQALKAVELEDVLRLEVVPILTDFSVHVLKVIEKFVPRDQQELAAQELRTLVAQSVTRARTTMEEAGKG